MKRKSRIGDQRERNSELVLREIDRNRNVGKSYLSQWSGWRPRRADDAKPLKRVLFGPKKSRKPVTLPALGKNHERRR